MQKSIVSQFSATLLVALLAAGCASVGPDYQRPAAAASGAYKSLELGEWKQGEPLDHVPKGEWWDLFGDPELDRLQRQAIAANQSLKAAFSSVNQARATARVARSEFFPTLDANVSYTRQRFSPNDEPSFGDVTTSSFRAPLDLSYEIDLWGRVRRSFESARAEAQAADASFHNLLLTLQADLAQNYFVLRGLDADITVLNRAIELRREQVKIVTSLLDTGLGSGLDVARAETELATTEAELAAANRRRAELENAIAILVGESPADFKLARLTDSYNGWRREPPAIPVGLPSQLLERRPDIAEAERQLAAANAQIGVAKAAFFPVVRLTGSGGFVSADVESLFNWESRAWSIGPSVSLPIFAGGRNLANLDRSRARYEQAVAQYRQQVLVAFGEVENALAGIHYLGKEAAAQERAVRSATEARERAAESFSSGLTDYLVVIDADRAALQARRSDIQVASQRLIASIQLIKALGGGWVAPAQLAKKS